jgi:hypothetical protein
MNKRFFFIFIFIVLLAGTISAFDFTNETIIYYTLNDSNANTTISTYAGDVGELLGGENTSNISIDGKLGTGLLFNGVDDYINTSGNGLNIAGDFSINFWIYPTNVDFDQQNMFDSTGAVIQMILSDAGSKDKKIRTLISTTNIDFKSTGTLSNDTWYMITFVFDRDGTSTIYFNAKANGTDTAGAGGSASSTAIKFGNYAGNKPFRGRFDETMIFNRTLTQKEVSDLYNDGYGLPYNKLNITINSQSISSSTTVGNSETYNINISFNDSEYTTSTADFYYNGTKYSGSRTGSSGTYVFTKALNTPSTSVSVNISAYWNVTLNNGTNHIFLSPTYNQSINVIGVDNCSAYSFTLYNFTLKDENSQTTINGTTQNTTADLNIQIYNTDGVTQVTNFSQNFNSTNPFAVCIQSNMSSGETYKLDLQLQYDGGDYASEFYHIQQETLTSADLNTSISLFHLLDDNAQEFKITYKDDSLLPVGNALIQVQRKYVDEGVFKVVEIPKTDTNGETLARLQLSDVVYTFVIVKDGSVLSTFDNVLAVCNNVATGDCEINLNAFSSHIAPKDYTTLDDFTFTLTHDQDTRTIQSVYSIPSSTTSTVTLNVTLYDLIGHTEVCSDSLTSAGGTLSCDVPVTYGNVSLFVVVKKDGVTQGGGIMTFRHKPSEIYGSNLVFLTVFLFLTLIGIGISPNPMITGVFVLVGGISAVLLNLTGGAFNFIGTGATILWLVMIIVIVLIKGAKRT